MKVISGCYFCRILSRFEAPLGIPLGEREIRRIRVFISEAYDNLAQGTRVSFKVAFIKMKKYMWQRVDQKRSDSDSF
jgi:hypothetical protein